MSADTQPHTDFSTRTQLALLLSLFSTSLPLSLFTTPTIASFLSFLSHSIPRPLLALSFYPLSDLFIFFSLFLSISLYLSSILHSTFRSLLFTFFFQSHPPPSHSFRYSSTQPSSFNHRPLSFTPSSCQRSHVS